MNDDASDSPQSSIPHCAVTLSGNPVRSNWRRSAFDSSCFVQPERCGGNYRTALLRVYPWVGVQNDPARGTAQPQTNLDRDREGWIAAGRGGVVGQSEVKGLLNQ